MMKKRLFSMITALALCLTLLPTAARAEGWTTELPEAVDNVITLDQHVDLSGKTWEIEDNATVTLDLNGYQVKSFNGTGEKTGIVIKPGSKLILKDSSAAQTGKIFANEKYVRDEKDAGIICVKGEFEMNSGLIDATTGNTPSTDGQYAVSMRGNSAKVTINGGRIQAGYYAVDSNGSKTQNATLEVNGGTLVSEGDYAIYMAGNDTVTINNGVVDGASGAVAVRNGTLYIKGGQLASEGTGNTGTGNDGTSGMGNAVVNVGDGSKGLYGNCKVEITGGTLTGSTAITVALKEGETKTADVAVTGGSFTDLASAVQYAASGAIIKLADHVTLDSTINVAKKITIDLNGKTITRGSGTAAQFGAFLVRSGGDLTLTGTGTITDVLSTCADSHLLYVWARTGKDAKLTIDSGVTVSTEHANTFCVTIGGNNSDKDTAKAYLVVKGTLASTHVSDKNEGAAPISGNGNAGCGNTYITIESGATVSSQSTYAIYHPQAGTLTINGGTITGVGGIEAKAGDTTITVSGDPTITATGTASHTENNNGSSTTGYALAVVENKNYAGGANMNIASGYFTGAIGIEKDNETEKAGTISITGGYFTSNPSAYVAENYHVNPSDKSGYTYMVNGTSANGDGADIFVSEDTAATVSSTISEDDTVEINKVLDKTSVTGTDLALNKTAFVNDKVGATDNRDVLVEITVKVEVKDYDSGDKTLTFSAAPYATIGSSNEIAVDNSYLNGKEITVKLPLPVGYTPKQIKHICKDGTEEYFILASEGSKYGAKTFTIEDGCAVFTITKFSTFELTANVTYVEPSTYFGGYSAPTYSVTAPAAANGTVTVTPKNAAAGVTVTITTAPKQGYVLKNLTVLDQRGNVIPLTDRGNGTYSFQMPAGNITVQAAFGPEKTVEDYFVDVPAGQYYYDAVLWAVTNGITGGVDDTHFGPDQNCQRAQLAAFLYRYAQSQGKGFTGAWMFQLPFGDVPEWCYESVAWCYMNEIVTGYGDALFGSSDDITREQVVTILYRFAVQVLGMDAVTMQELVSGYGDAGEVSDYAIPAMNWALANGIVQGADGSLMPGQSCTRAEIVTMLYRLLGE